MSDDTLYRYGGLKSDSGVYMRCGNVLKKRKKEAHASIISNSLLNCG